jgi:hypothetical protein
MTFREPLWDPSSLVKSPEDKCSVDWDAILYRGWVVVGGVYVGTAGEWRKLLWEKTGPTGSWRHSSAVRPQRHPNPLNICPLDSWPVKMGPTVVPETLSTKLTCTPCKTRKPKYQLLFYCWWQLYQLCISQIHQANSVFFHVVALPLLFMEVLYSLMHLHL